MSSISPVSSRPTFATTGVSAPSEAATPRLQRAEARQPDQGMALKKMLSSDGFDAPGGLKGGQLEATVKMLTQVAELLAQSVKMLGSELSGGAQGLSGAGGAAQCGVPDLGGDAGADLGGVPDLGGDLGGVPDLAGAEGGDPALAAEAGAAPAAAQAAQAAQAPAAAAPTSAPEAPSEAKAVSGSNGAPKGERTMTFTNDGKSDMTINFTPNAGEKEIPPLTLKPGETTTVDFPEGWCGNFRSANGDGKNATLGEVKFNGGGNQTFYDVSYIEGANAAMTIAPDSGGKVSGTMDNLLASAPDSIKAKDDAGNVYGIKKTTTSNVVDQGVVDYYRQKVGADQGYVIPWDDASTLGTSSSNLTVHLKDLE
ncbi:thaumatin family protein [Hyalangium versicolor]|uniref:thaumatin family protein n=1 Tax=Hyalangium versicolor TaxID=2861190 RepID=UPI00272C8B30|nr:thaumatin family protein [Hyalangium versicolor]